MRLTGIAPPNWVQPHLEIEEDYPTDEALEIIAEWPYDKAKELILALKEAWIYPDYFVEDEAVPGCYHVSTGGWSGHESMLGAMQENAMVWNQVWVANKVGGHFIFGTGFACYGGSSDQINVRFEVKAP